MKKTIYIIIIIICILQSSYFSKTHACPHFDDYGVYIEQYNSVDTEYVKVYSSFEYHLVNVYIPIENLEFGDINKVEFSMYMFNRWHPVPEIFYKPLNSQVEYVFMHYNYFSLSVPIKQLYSKYQSFSTNQIYGISYDIITEPINNQDKDLIIDKINDNNLYFIDADILDVEIGLNYRLHSYFYTPKYIINLDYYYEPITLTFDLAQVDLDGLDTNTITAINITEDNIYELEGNYNQDQNTFTFKANKRGIYTIVSNKNNVILDNEPLSENHLTQKIIRSIENLPDINSQSDINNINITLFAIRAEYELLASQDKAKINNIYKLEQAEQQFYDLLGSNDNGNNDNEDKDKNNDKDNNGNSDSDDEKKNNLEKFSCKSSLNSGISGFFAVVTILLILYISFMYITEKKD